MELKGVWRVEVCCVFVFFFQAEDGIREAQEARGLGDGYRRRASYVAVAVRVAATGT